MPFLSGSSRRRRAQVVAVCAWQLVWAAGLVENVRLFAASAASTPASVVIVGQATLFFAFTTVLAAGLLIQAWRRRRPTFGAAGLLLLVAAGLLAVQLEPHATHWLVLRYRTPGTMDVWVDGQSASVRAIPPVDAPPGTAIRLASAGVHYDVVAVLDGWLPRTAAIRAARAARQDQGAAESGVRIVRLAGRASDSPDPLPQASRSSATLVAAWRGVGYPLRARSLLQMIGGGARYADIELRRARVVAAMRGPEAIVPIAHRAGLQGLAIGFVLGAGLLLHGGLRRWLLAAVA